MFVKICGLNSPAGVEAAVAAGADAIGFVFAHSPREVTPQRAKELCVNVPPTIMRVAVMQHPEPEQWRQVMKVFAPNWLQTDAEDLNAIPLPPGCTALPVYRTGHSAARRELPARLVFEGTVSGSGTTADWNTARQLARRTELILAGGLSGDNIADAIKHVRPWGVDVSSGVEIRRGEKDPAKIKEFVARVRALQE